MKRDTKEIIKRLTEMRNYEQTLYKFAKSDYDEKDFGYKTLKGTMDKHQRNADALSFAIELCQKELEGK